uniref:HTH myb-type domain-containing protein n=2 Tax=Glycine subgen. Soja TaxID=1462606 RepID=I1LF38_SOYBN
MDVKGLTISHVKSHLQMYRSMRGDLGRQGRTPSQHRNQSFEEHDDGCVDEVNDVGVEYSCSKPLGRESDSFFGHSNLPPKRARIEMRSSISERLQQCSQRLCDVVVPNPYCFYDYLKQKKPMPMADQHSPPFPDFPNLTSFKSPDQQSDFLQVTKLNEGKSTSQTINVLVNTTTETANVEIEDELSLSLTLPNPSPQRSSGSEISEAISSCHGFSNNYKDCSSSSTHTVKERINLDLSLALCGN